jgi:hypothetical protein
MTYIVSFGLAALIVAGLMAAVCCGGGIKIVKIIKRIRKERQVATAEAAQEERNKMRLEGVTVG